MRLAVVLVTLFLSLASAARADEITRLVVFGDSLSDPGNHFIAFGTSARQPYEPVPEASYAVGGHHFSNGATWAERLAADLGAPTSGGPALSVSGLFTNYAVGRARARAGAPAFPDHDLRTQIGQFLTDFRGQAPSGDLYVVWIGANDVSDALSALAIDPSGATSLAILNAAITATADGILELWTAGARTFIVPNVPNLAITPVIRELDPSIQTAAAQLSAAYNGALEQALSALQTLPGITLTRLDVHGLFAQVLANPAEVGLTNVTDPCLTFGVGSRAVCATPQQYLFWDGIHPTATGHAVISEAALLAVKP